MTHTQKIKAASFSALILAMILTLASCYEPSPLYGTWTDDHGSKITFMMDDTYTATITSTNGIENSYSGTYTVIRNALSFVKEDKSTIVTEWDIRGSMLYLNWTSDSETQQLTLYKISN